MPLLDPGIINSSLWNEPLATRVVWITLLALQDCDGFVSSSKSGLKRYSNVTCNDFDIALACLEGPDDDSRTQEHDGRRIKKIEGGWLILNHDKYRITNDLQREKTRERVRREKTRERVRKHRDKNRGCNVTGVTVTLHSVTSALHSCNDLSDNTLRSVTERYNDISDNNNNIININNTNTLEDTSNTSNNTLEDTSNNNNNYTSNNTSKQTISPLVSETTWKTDYNIYKQQCDAAFTLYHDNWDWIAEKKAWYPSVHIQKSLEKMFFQYWSTEDTWKKMKRKRIKDINWKSTIENGLSMSFNKVYIPRGEQDPELQHIEIIAKRKKAQNEPN